MPTQPVYPMPARYRVLADAYIDDVYYPASNEAVSMFVDYAGHPGTALEPTDDEGRCRQAAYFATRGTTAERALSDKRRLTQGAFDPGVLSVAPAHAVEIPTDWQSLSAGARVLLAAKLGAPETCDTALLADDFIAAAAQEG